MEQKNNDIFLPVLVLLGMFALILGALTLSTQPEPQSSEEVAAVAVTNVTEEPTEEEPTQDVAVDLWEGYYHPDDVAEGRSLYGSTCAACHGSNAEGISGLGKNLIQSEFVNNLTDEELHAFIITGREAWDPANTTGIPMPPRGGNPALSDASIDLIIAYLRATANPALVSSNARHIISQTDQQPYQEQNTETVSVQPTDVQPTAIPASPTPSEPRPTSTPRPPRVFDPANAFAISCSGCHGADGTGIDGLTTSLFESNLINDPDALFNFVAEGNPLANPLEAFPHPPRGEYPTHTDEELRQIIDYLLSLGN